MNSYLLTTRRPKALYTRHHTARCTLAAGKSLLGRSKAGRSGRSRCSLDPSIYSD